MKTKEASEQMSRLRIFVPPSQKLETVYTDSSKACQALHWNHDTSTLHRSEPNGVAERAVRIVKEGTAMALVKKADFQMNGGTVRWNAVVTCGTCVTCNALEKRYGQKFDR